ncbi:MAG: pyruvate ferredoxin oxidoreductase beta subunit, partial [Thermodesulfobacterium sp.]|nr:pyruvate ferredoxin oxidoreductase beta subunit [Thermodesulfobacterium sp.]MDN5379495.1 pyruvate ferredoxin oxidoreductase beta subunit [Thermodesulfobacterium sp.]
EQIAYIQERVNQEYEKLLKLAECFGEPQTEQKEE